LKNKLLFLISVLIVVACNNNKPKPTVAAPQAVQPAAPLFDADSAYSFVKTQCDFGTRVTNSKGHDACGDYLVARMRSYTSNVLVQKGNVTAYTGVTLHIKNILVQFNPTAQKRILLFAHWDTRPWADRDSVRPNEPIMGADDAGSGTGVLLEIARILSQHPPSVGVDLALFDAEDYGTKNGEESIEESYALGTQYWCKNPVPAGYKAEYGILLDMVGGYDAQFNVEGYSKQYASNVVTNVWNAASRAGYSKYFIYLEGGYITDDHVFVNQVAGIPSIDIIPTLAKTETGFPSHWHTHRDNMDVIDKNTLKAVGQTLLELIFVSPGI
jgi:hypothetical protein